LEQKLIGITPTKKQQEIIQGIRSPHKYHIVAIGRQSGKSLLAMNLVLDWSINNPLSTILWVSPVYSQTTKVQKELFKALVDTGIVDSCNYSENIITLKNGSEIIFRSAERYDNIRGYTIDYCIIDEAAFIKEEAWTEAIKPTLLVRGKKCLFLSTPKGKNWFYKLYQMGISDDHNEYKSYKGTSMDNPYADVKEIEDSRKTLPENVYRQEYLAEFIEGGGEVFRNIKTFDQYPISKGTIYMGVDLGRQEDYTVCTLMDMEGQVIEIYRARQQEWNYIINDIVELAKHSNAYVLIEANSIGDVIYEQVKKRYNKTEPFITTSKSKQEIIEGLILDFNEGNITIPSQKLFAPLYNELNSFTYEYSSKTRQIKYGAPTGLHDDCVMSLAITNYARKTMKSRGKYNWIR